MRRILVTGALGQIGSELVPALRARFGAEQVIASDIRVPPAGAGTDGPFAVLDVTNFRQLQDLVRRHEIGTIYHLAALLSATAEERPHVAWEINMGGLYKILEVARENRCALFHPSSIAAFGPGTPRAGTPQDTVQRPNTMYGVTKVAGELLADYYAHRFGLDVRGLRFPGLISHTALPGGGTTDYAVAIFYDALRHGRYRCFLGPDTRLDMMYMPDAVRATLELMEADPARLKHRNAFNVAAANFTPAELAAEIRRHLPGFEIEYEIDPVRQAIADSWPQSLDDAAARAEWGWQPRYDLAAMTAEMLDQLRPKLRLS
ncbi:MAG: L-threonine 3-dehydrogenase [Thermoanaerobaculia bacterium]|nr:MAG: L-threonine 3-dehydrogenase [Thermoanaerobaculia bacterium]